MTREPGSLGSPGGGAFRVGDFVFDPSTGEVSVLDTGAEGSTTRLPPQAARVLEMLIERGGDLVTRDEIREDLWPDSYVDFDQSLNFCVRQIRAALGDSAAEPVYIETLPRRGYRLLRSVDRHDSGDSRSAVEERKPGPRAPRWAGIGGIVVGILALTLVVVGRGCAGRPPTAASVRLAIMPFELSAAEGEGAELARISEWLVAELASTQEHDVQVLGPRSTARYSAFPFPRLEALAEALAADFVLNARFMVPSGEEEQALIVELIRLDDASHPWVQLYRGRRPWEEIAADIHAGVLTVLSDEP